MAFTGHHSAVVVLFLARRRTGRVIEVRYCDLMGLQFGDGFHIAATAENVKGIKHGGGMRMIGGGHDF